MGLDVILGVFLLVAAIRGWFKGFVLQAIQLGGLVACVYEAGPLRDAVRPHIDGYLKGIRPDVLDRLLWWVACVLGYVVTVGLATWLVRVYRRRPYGEPDLYRGDQAAGLLLGGAKGALVALLITAALDHYALGYIHKVGGWTEEQTTTSYALGWNAKYRPIPRIWAMQPVQRFVAYVKKMGVQPPEGSTSASSNAQTARSSEPPRTMEVPREGSGSDKADLDKIEQELSRLRQSLEKPDDSN